MVGLNFRLLRWIVKDSQLDFEKSFKRLEEILEKMNGGKASLDESMSLYEEADGLIGSMTTKLNEAEAKVEMLIKKRNGELEIDDNARAKVQDFQLQE